MPTHQVLRSPLTSPRSTKITSGHDFASTTFEHTASGNDLIRIGHASQQFEDKHAHAIRRKQTCLEQYCIPPDALLGDHGPEVSDAEYYRAVVWTTIVGTVVNVVLVFVKFIAGILWNSQALLADAVHSLMDVFTDFVTLVAARIAAKPADEKFPYRYGKLESIAAVWVSVCLVFSAGGMFWYVCEKLVSEYEIEFMNLTGRGRADGQEEKEDGLVSVEAISVAIASVLAKEATFQFTMRIGKRLQSQVLVANAWHHRSDALGSVAALVGVVGAVYGYPIMDKLAAIFVCALLGKVGIEVGWEAVKTLADTNCAEEIDERVREIVRNECGEDTHVSGLRARMNGRKLSVDFFLAFLRKGITTEEVIGKMQAARERVLEEIPELGEVVIQLRDSEEQEYLRSQGGSGGGGFTWFTRGKSGGGL